MATSFGLNGGNQEFGVLVDRLLVEGIDLRRLSLSFTAFLFSSSISFLLCPSRWDSTAEHLDKCSLENVHYKQNRFEFSRKSVGY
jgi:hypothetical protein